MRKKGLSINILIDVINIFFHNRVRTAAGIPFVTRAKKAVGMDINQLKYFVSVSQTLNFTEAARRHGLTQPAISHHINELEAQLGSKLFTRDRRSVALTESGRGFLPYALEMIELSEKAAFQISQMKKGYKGSLSIAALTTSSAILSRCLSVYSGRYPDITIDINFTSGRSQVLAMNENKYDFHFAVREMIPAGQTFDFIETHTDQLCAAFHKDHPLARRPLDFSKLADERFIAVSESDGPALFNQIADICSARGYKPKISCRYDRAEAVLLSVGAGLGISIVPEALRKVFYAENVVFIPIPGEDTLRTYVVAWHKANTNPAVELFRNVLKELFPNNA